MKMKRNSIVEILLLMLALLAGCDEGKIYPEPEKEEEGGTGVMQVVFDGQQAWPQEYMLVFAAFGDNADMPIVSKIIPKPQTADEVVEVRLTGLDEQAKKLSVSVVNKGRQPIYEFASCSIANPAKETVLPDKKIDLATFDRVQQQVFNAFCIRCHGAGTNAAADLYLTEVRTPESLVGVASALSAKKYKLVEPGDPARSFLMSILEEDIIHYNHTDVLPEAELITLIETWIKEGAK